MQETVWVHPLSIQACIRSKIALAHVHRCCQALIVANRLGFLGRVLLSWVHIPWCDAFVVLRTAVILWQCKYLGILIINTLNTCRSLIHPLSTASNAASNIIGSIIAGPNAWYSMAALAFETCVLIFILAIIPELAVYSFEVVAGEILRSLAGVVLVVDQLVQVLVILLWVVVLAKVYIHCVGHERIVKITDHLAIEGHTLMLNIGTAPPTNRVGQLATDTEWPSHPQARLFFTTDRLTCTARGCSCERGVLSASYCWAFSVPWFGARGLLLDFTELSDWHLADSYGIDRIETLIESLLLLLIWRGLSHTIVVLRLSTLFELALFDRVAHLLVAIGEEMDVRYQVRSVLSW